MKIAESLQSLSDAKMRYVVVRGLSAAPVMTRLAGRPLPRGRLGFTMIELVTIMLVIGILAVVVLPRMDMFAAFGEAGYRDKVKATLEFARKSAVAQRRNVRVVIASSQLAVTVEQATPEGDAGTPGSYAAFNLPGSATNQFGAPAGVTLTPDTTLTFNALGRPSAGATLTVSGGGGNIAVEAETGHVH